MTPKRVAVFGSTGSIGNATLEVIAHLPGKLKLVAITAHQAVRQICLQAQNYHPRYVVLTDPAAAESARRY